MKCSGISLILILCSLAFPLKAATVHIETEPGDNWPTATRQLMEKAAQIVFDRIASTDVAQCAYRNSFREKVDKVRAKWGAEITVLNKNSDVTLKVLKKKLDRSILGLAQLNKAQVDRNYFRIHQLEIILNEDNLNQHAEKLLQVDGDKELNIWVNTIAHEVAHNFGYKHGQSGTWLKDYPGYFPTELGFCVMSSGKNGSDLGDYELRRTYKDIR